MCTYRLILALLFACGMGIALPTVCDCAAADEIAKRHDAASPTGKTAADQETISIRLDRDSKPPRFVLDGLTSGELDRIAAANWGANEWAARFAIYTVSKADSPRLPMLGRWTTDNRSITFEPRFPLKPGVSYSVEVRPDLLAGRKATESVVKTFQLPVPERARTRVVQVYPTREQLPENQLKFYLHFSAPMARGYVYEYVHLLDADGNVVADPFLELPQELWDRTGTRITMLIDPGRIKRGLKPREDIGPVLEQDHSYTLVIGHDWPDAVGNPLADSFQKPIRAVTPDETQPDPAAWSIEAPVAGTTEPLVVRFGEPLDHAMLLHAMAITDNAGQVVQGRVDIDQQETRWRFFPKDAWRAGEYRLAAEKDLEDLAGNSIGRPFEVDMIHPPEDEKVLATVSVPFRVGSASRAASDRGQ